MELVDALVFRSHADPDLTDAELEVLLLEARALSKARGITGVILKTDHVLLQFLEGTDAALSRAFTLTNRSLVHDEVEILHRSHGVPRQFADWHMGFRVFQLRHSRSEANEEWLQVLPRVRQASTANPALAALLREWDQRWERQENHATDAFDQEPAPFRDL